MKRTGIVATLLFATACGSNPAPPPPVVHTTLASEALSDDKFARRTLYTWTTTEQADALRASDQLLVREVSPVHGPAAVDIALSELAATGDPVAKLLYTTTYAKSRFAWHAPWATRLGWPGEHYGDELIRVTLKADAIILLLHRAHGVFVAHDLEDRPIALADVLAHPERIAALYFVNDGVGAQFREFVLCNESMIESWEIGTDEIARELADEADLLEHLGQQIGDRTIGPTPDTPGGQFPPYQDDYTAALALISDPFYVMTRQRLAALAHVLRATPRRFIARGGNCAQFSGVGEPRPQVTPAARRPDYVGSYPGSYGSYR